MNAITSRWGRRPRSIYGPLDRRMIDVATTLPLEVFTQRNFVADVFRDANDVATTLPLEVFIQRNFVADFFRQKLNFTGTNSDIAFLCPLWGT